MEKGKDAPKPTPSHEKEHLAALGQRLAELEQRVKASEKDVSEIQQVAAFGQRMTEFERRVKANEDTAAEVQRNHIGHIKWMVGITMIVVGWFAYLNRSDTKDASDKLRAEASNVEIKSHDRLSEMQTNLDGQMFLLETNFNGQMLLFEKRFEELAGDALKRPVLQLLISNNVPLDLHYFPRPAFGNYVFPPAIFYLKNIGERKTDQMKMQLFASEEIPLDRGGGAYAYQTTDTNYPFGYQLDFRATGIDLESVAAKQEIPLPIGCFGSFRWDRTGTNPIACRLVIYYGGDAPLEQKFYYW